MWESEKVCLLNEPAVSSPKVHKKHLRVKFIFKGKIKNTVRPNVNCTTSGFNKIWGSITQKCYSIEPSLIAVCSLDWMSKHLRQAGNRKHIDHQCWRWSGAQMVSNKWIVCYKQPESAGQSGPNCINTKVTITQPRWTNYESHFKDGAWPGVLGFSDHNEPDDQRFFSLFCHCATFGQRCNYEKCTSHSVSFKDTDFCSSACIWADWETVTLQQGSEVVR